MICLNFSNDIQILDRVVSVAIKAEFHTNRNTKIKEGTEKDNEAYSANRDDSNGDNTNFEEVKELNYQEKARLHELYEASRSLACPLEQDKDVSCPTFNFLSNFFLFVTLKHFSN